MMRLPSIKISADSLGFKLIKYKKKIFIILTVALATTFLSGLIYQDRIEPTSLPENVWISNVTDQSLTISWTTPKPCFGFVFYSSKKIPFALLTRIPFLTSLMISHFYFPYPKIAADDHLDFDNTHHVTLKNLKPETAYYYRISTGLHLYRYYLEEDKKQILPSIKTGPVLEELSVPEPVYGQVVLEKDLETPVKNAIVYFKTFESNLLSTLTSDYGNYILDLSNLRTKDFKNQVILDQDRPINLEVEAKPLGKGKISVDLKMTRPVVKILVSPKLKV